MASLQVYLVFNSIKQGAANSLVTLKDLQYVKACNLNL
jgi:hypothetical protein